MQDSVQHHMISDVPVGAFLSGGIDSAITVTLMQRERERLGLAPVETFTIGFEEVSEHETAREVSDALKTNHHEIKISFDEYLKELPQIAWYFDEPVADPSAVALYFLAREARKHVKVVLSGEGSDELFGGYNIYREPFDLQHIATLPKWIKDICIKPFTTLPFHFFGKNYLRRALTSFNDRYIGNAYIFKPEEVSRLWKTNVYAEMLQSRDIQSGIHVKPGQALESQIPEFNQLPESRKMQLVDMHYWLRGDILAKADKMTMAHSLELRVPYLDRDVAAVSATIDDSLKYKNGKTKYILRKAFESILPQTTADRKKLGFPTPIKHWLKKNPDEIMRTIKNNSYIKEHFDLTYIDNLLSEHVAGKRDHARKIYVLLMLSLWYNQFIK
jgi:asparagine synthase (glutamine-hydrolysing)